MKKLMLLPMILLSLQMAILANNQSVPVTVNLTAVGKLQTTLSTMSPATITKLTITGLMNAADFTYLKTNSNMPLLDSVDISGVTSNISTTNGLFLNKTSLKYIKFPANLTGLGSTIFKGCTNLTEVILPQSLTTIGGSSFIGCENLETITFPVSLTSIPNFIFNGCAKLKHVVLASESKLTSIGNYSFANTGLTSFVMPSGVTHIGNAAFSNCFNLETFTLSNVDSIMNTAFSACGKLKTINLPANLKYIGTSAFYNCKSLDNITLPAQLRNIKQTAFSGCSNLQNITIPQTVDSIGTEAFAGCLRLSAINVVATNPNFTSTDGVLYKKTNVLLTYPSGRLADQFIIPSTVDSIGNAAFADSVMVKEVVIPESVKLIAKGSFRNNPYMTAITINSANNNYKSIDGVVYDKVDTLLLAYPAGKAMHDYTLPSTLKTIGYYAFNGCSLLTGNIVLPKRVKSIPTYCFAGCSSLSGITFQDSVTTVTANAFLNCKSLSYIDSKSIVAPSVSNINAFAGVDTLNCELKVPIGSSISYQIATGWSSFKKIVEVASAVNTISRDIISTCLNSNHDLIVYGADQAYLEVFSILGTCIYTGRVLSNSYTLNTDSLYKGNYIVSIRKDNNRHVVKLSK